MAAIALATALLLLLPKWIGGAQFFVFQGNIWDQWAVSLEVSPIGEFSYGDVLAADRTMPLPTTSFSFAHASSPSDPP